MFIQRISNAFPFGSAHLKLIRPSLAPTPRPSLALRLGYTAQDDFFGSRRHAGWTWLATQAREWPTPYRTDFWAGFEGPMTD
jgi:hypothetical protein